MATNFTTLYVGTTELKVNVVFIRTNFHKLNLMTVFYLKTYFRQRSANPFIKNYSTITNCK